MGILDSIRQSAERKRLEAEHGAHSKDQQRVYEAEDAKQRDVGSQRAQQAHAERDKASLPQSRQNEAGPAERLISQDNKQRLREAASLTHKPEPQLESRQERPIVATEKEHKFEPVHAQPSVGPGQFTSRTAQREGIAARMQRQGREAEAAMKPEQKVERDTQRQEQLDRLVNSKARTLVGGSGRER